jgi:hypothetical protein
MLITFLCNPRTTLCRSQQCPPFRDYEFGYRTFATTEYTVFNYFLVTCINTIIINLCSSYSGGSGKFELDECVEVILGVIRAVNDSLHQIDIKGLFKPDE